MENIYLEEKGIRRTIDLYAHYADTREADKQADLFAKDSVFRVFAAGEEETPAQTFTTREEYLAVFEDLNRYEKTFHFNGQAMIDIVENGMKGIAETYTLAHHILTVDGKPTLMNAALRYNDTFIKEDGIWKFKTRDIHIRFIETIYDFKSDRL